MTTIDGKQEEWIINGRYLFQLKKIKEVEAHFDEVYQYQHERQSSFARYCAGKGTKGKRLLKFI